MALPTSETVGTFGNPSNELQDKRKMQLALKLYF
jgi:hypothetical protein